MSRLIAPMALVVELIGSVGCSRDSSRAAASSVDGSTAANAALPAVGASTDASSAGSALQLLSPPVFSAPIAAVRAQHQSVVAGLVAAPGVIRVMGLTAGQPSWSKDVLHGVAWAPDAELKMLSAPDGLALVWRGLLGGKMGTTLIVVGPHGEPRGDAIPIGAGSCATADGVAWLDPRSTGPLHIRSRSWDRPDARDVVTLSPDRAPTLVCAEHTAFVLGDGDDDLTATAFSPGEGAAQPTMVAIRDHDFGDDDEREHQAFTVGDDLNLVRIGGGGAIAIRQISGGHASSWHRVKRALSDDDDVVAVDGDEATTSVVFARSAPDACPSESGAQIVRALRIDRKSGDEELVSLASADCASTPGSFWTGRAPSASVVAWSQRRSRPGQDAAPIEGLIYRAFLADRPKEGRSEVEADALVDAGCDEVGCFSAALVRTPDNDGGRPESILILGYPP